MSTMLKEVYDALKEAGASEEKASAAAVAISAYQLNRGNLATKEDTAALKGDIARLEKASKEDTAMLKEDLHDLKTDLAVLKAELGMVKWFLGSIGFGVVLLLIRAFWPVVTA